MRRRVRGAGGSASTNRFRPARAPGDGTRCRRRGPRGLERRTAWRSASRGNRRRPGSRCASTTLREGWVRGVIVPVDPGGTPKLRVELFECLQDPIDLVRRVVMAEADPDRATGVEQPEPVEHLDRVVVTVPREDAAPGECRCRLLRMLSSDPDG